MTPTFADGCRIGRTGSRSALESVIRQILMQEWANMESCGTVLTMPLPSIHTTYPCAPSVAVASSRVGLFRPGLWADERRRWKRPLIPFWKGRMYAAGASCRSAAVASLSGADDVPVVSGAWLTVWARPTKPTKRSSSAHSAAIRGGAVGSRRGSPAIGGARWMASGSCSSCCGTA